jgi:hypothetical protein
MDIGAKRGNRDYRADRIVSGSDGLAVPRPIDKAVEQYAIMKAPVFESKMKKAVEKLFNA